MAKEAAEQAEADRKEQARARELASQCRASQQHLARLEKEITAAAAAGAAMQRSFDRAADAARSALAAMTPQLRAAHWMQLAPKYLQRLLLIETHQAGKRSGSITVVIPEMVGFAEDMKGWASGNVPNIQTLLGRDLGVIRAKLRSLMPPQGSSDAATSPGPASDDAAVSGEVPPIPEAAAISLDVSIEERAA
jgi:hypothetical protein